MLFAIHTLYGQDTAQQSAASAWLNSFSNSAEAWPLALTLLDETSLEARFFAANMILSKARRDWSRLTPEQQSQLIAAIRYIQPCIGVQNVRASSGPRASSSTITNVKLLLKHKGAQYWCGACRHRIETQSGESAVVQQRLCLVLSTMTVMQGDAVAAALLHDVMTWAHQVMTAAHPI